MNSKLTKTQLLEQLKSIHAQSRDPEGDHVNADQLLLDYINDPEITQAFELIDKWYA